MPTIELRTSSACTKKDEQNKQLYLQATEQATKKTGETEATDDGENRCEQGEEKDEESSDQGKHDAQQREDEIPDGP